MIDDALMQYAGKALQRTVLARSVVTRVRVWYSPQAFRSPISLSVEYPPLNPSGFFAGRELVIVPGAILDGLDRGKCEAIIDWVVGDMANRIYDKAPRVANQTGSLEITPIKKPRARRVRA